MNTVEYIENHLRGRPPTQSIIWMGLIGNVSIDFSLDELLPAKTMKSVSHAITGAKPQNDCWAKNKQFSPPGAVSLQFSRGG